MPMNSTRNSSIVSPGAKQSQRTVQFHPSVLVVDDEMVIADTITKILSLNGYNATAAYDGDSALESALLKPPHLLLTDVILPGINGIELAQTVKRVYPDCKILLFSGQASTIDLLASASHDVRRFTLLSKPVAPDRLLAMVAEQLNPNPVHTAQQTVAAR
jgi:DNA-binding NtrC family response regulator